MTPYTLTFDPLQGGMSGVCGHRLTQWSLCTREDDWICWYVLNDCIRVGSVYLHVISFLFYCVHMSKGLEGRAGGTFEN